MINQSSKSIENSGLSAWPIYVISLIDSTKRRETIIEQFDGLSLKFSFFDAIDGREKIPAQYESLIDRQTTILNLGREMSDGEYACAISHMEIYKKIVMEKLDGAIIFEDDAILTPLFLDFLKYSGYKMAPLIQLDHRGGFVHRFANKIKIGRSITLRRATLNPQLTTAYSINSSAAQYLLEHGLPLAGTADWPCDITVLSANLTSPCIIKHPKDNLASSTLAEQRLKKVNKVKYRWKKFANSNYWKRWWIKRVISKRIS